MDRRLTSDSPELGGSRRPADIDFVLFFERYATTVRSWAVRSLGPYRSDADDIVHDVMLAAYEEARRPGGFDLAAIPEGWLRKVTRNKTVDHLRFAWKRAVPMADDELRKIPASYSPTGEDTLIARELLVLAMQGLSLRQREVLSRSLAGYSTAEITEMLGYYSEKSVQQQLYRARKIVRDRVLAAIAADGIA
ncbi:RNA polymerase sigma factor [Nocardia salmonicida]|uniref:RNA polymerase sigma factor n=1 Tax=Nocardia salmonicida TaxID=53431 RepID=UPI0037B2441E